MDCHFRDLPDFRGTINDSFSSKYMRQHMDQWTQYSLNLWTAEAVINRASELWKSGKSRKWQSLRNYS